MLHEFAFKDENTGSPIRLCENLISNLPRPDSGQTGNQYEIISSFNNKNLKIKNGRETTAKGRNIVAFCINNFIFKNIYFMGFLW